MHGRRNTIRGLQSAADKGHRSSRISKSSIAGYIGVFFLVISLVAIGHQPPQPIKGTASAAESQPTIRESASLSTIAVDDTTAANLAANIAQVTNLPVATNVANLSQSISAESVLTQNDENLVTKPQVVQPGTDTREIKTYVGKTGDTVQDVAAKFNVSVQTIKWVNNMTSDAIEEGRTLKILPTDGVLYTVKDGDSVESIAQKYQANAEQIRTYNDLELGGLDAGKEIIIPSGELPETERPGYVAPVSTYTYTGTQGVNFSAYSGGSATSNNLVASVGNRYAFGNCTWYVYERRVALGRPVGSFWGNAASWGYYAATSGYTVTGTPTVGSVMVNGGGYGHVAIVESINPGVSVTISEMNAYRFGGGFNRIGHGDIPWSEAVGGMYQYIE